MEMTSRLLLVILILLNLANSVDSLRAADSKVGRPEDQLLVMEVVKQFVLAWNQDDADQLSRLFTPNGILISPSGATAKTRSGIKELLINEHREIFVGTVLRKTIRTVRFDGSAVALVKGQYELGGIETFLGFVTSVNGTFDFNLEKQADEWLINRAHITRKR